MIEKKNIFAIIGSASKNSANQKLLENFADLTQIYFNLTVFNDLKTLPHFDPDCSAYDTPTEIISLRNKIEKADGVLICTPEYIFSIPSGLKNALEWLVPSMVLLDKPTALITASASGQKAHEELQLIMKTLMAKFSNETTILIPGIKGKINDQAIIIDLKTQADFAQFAKAFKSLVSNKNY